MACRAGMPANADQLPLLLVLLSSCCQPARPPLLPAGRPAGQRHRDRRSGQRHRPCGAQHRQARAHGGRPLVLGQVAAQQHFLWTSSEWPRALAAPPCCVPLILWSLPPPRPPLAAAQRSGTRQMRWCLPSQSQACRAGWAKQYCCAVPLVAAAAHAACCLCAAGMATATLLNCTCLPPRLCIPPCRHAAPGAGQPGAGRPAGVQGRDEAAIK